MSRFLSQRFSALQPYTPGEQPQDKAYVKLNTNESPFPPAPAVIEAVNAEVLEKLNLYSDPECRALRKKLAAAYGVGWENVFVSNGSDDILNFAFIAFCDKSRPVAFPSLSYGFYPVYARFHQLPYTAVPLRDGFRVDVEDYTAFRANIVLANPNAPTGRAVPVSDIEKLLRTHREYVVLVDEAYIDFGGESCRPLLSQYDNLLICQTFSKSRSMAGARLGFALGSKALIQDLTAIQFSANPYSVNSMTQAAAIAALDSQAYYDKNCRIIAENRAYTVSELDKLDFETVPSVANFIFTRHAKLSGGQLYQGLKDRGVLVRHWENPTIAPYCRVSIGSKEQMDVFLTKAREILEENGYA